MKNFGIQKYFISIRGSHESATMHTKENESNWEGQKKVSKIWNSPIVADNRLRIEELRLIERAVSEKKK